jgi:hypothetical protein
MLQLPRDQAHAVLPAAGAGETVLEAPQLTAPGHEGRTLRGDAECLRDELLAAPVSPRVGRSLRGVVRRHGRSIIELHRGTGLVLKAIASDVIVLLLKESNN